ncbi:MAG: hypothetical protein GW905_10425 [Rhodobacterales bacterium]|nr:hypothetical protein [Rhodobacterales bacterium]NCO85184.1 hypothetical protein [Rhodobacterales bacterium]NCT12931.1 hypothetical protein [Rhodobacterales bacterium]
MTSEPTSTLAQLFFADAPDLDFTSEVAALARAFSQGLLPELTWDHDDVAMLDFGPLRITLAIASGLRRAEQTCLTVAVGDGPGSGRSLTTLRHDAICKTITTRLARKHPITRMVWHVLPAVVTTDLIDQMTDVIATSDDDVMARLGATLATGQSQPAAPRKPSATEVIMTLRAGARSAVCKLRNLPRHHPLADRAQQA